MSRLVGDPIARVDGALKVTGRAKYTAEVPLDGLAYAVMVTSTIGNGKILSIDQSAARKEPGVIAILTHENAPRVHIAEPNGQNRVLRVLQDDVVYYDRQPVAVVVADSFERATHAAALLRITYDSKPVATRITAGTPYAPKVVQQRPADIKRGDADAAFASSVVKLDQTYRTPIYHHNPMEPHATTATWDSDKLTVHNASQGVDGDRRVLSSTFGIPSENVRVISSYIGGGFGCKGTPWSHVVLASMAARVTRRPVKLVLTRPQMFSSVGHRPETIQRVALGADHNGKIVAQIHEVTSHTSVFDEFTEPSGRFSVMLYDVPNSRISQRLVRLNTATPTFTRAPGETSGSFAFESAMDELAYLTGVDPVELRLRNYAETDPDARLPYSSKSLRACYEQGAQRFGWSRRNANPRSTRDGNMLVGMGMATAVYPSNRSEAGALVRIFADGSALVQSAGVDIGTGAYTVFTQLTAENLGLPVERVRIGLGDTTMPIAPNAGGSQLTASVGTAIKLAAIDARAKVAAMGSVSPGSLSSPEAYAAIIRRAGVASVDGMSDAKKPDDAQKKFATFAFGAHFAEVQVDPDLGQVRVTRFVGAFASGRILNAQTARSQYMGGIVWGIGNALTEITRTDLRSGRIMTANLAEYLVPVNADVPAIDVVIVPEDDQNINPIGTKGIGEIGIVGAAAAIANAVYHATGVRVRELPITPDKLLT
jgi:xanthine dehydrogenase YagR molybdenum-binding subunit